MDVRRTLCELDALYFALREEPHDVHIDKVHLTQIEHDVDATLLLEASAQIRQVLRADASAQGQRGRSGVR